MANGGKMTVANRIKDGLEVAKLQLVDLEKKIGGLPKKTLSEVQTRIDEVPLQLKGAWELVVVRLRGALDYASREELAELAEKVDDLAKKVEKLIRGDKIRSSAEQKEQQKKPGKKS
jgi:hypothetical protein